MRSAHGRRDEPRRRGRRVLGLAVDEEDVVYWSDGGNLYRGDAGELTFLTHSETGDIQAIAVDSASLYFTLASGRLEAMPRTGGAWSQLAAGLLVSTDRLFLFGKSFIASGTDTSGAGRVLRVDGDGSVHVLFESTYAPVSIARDDAFLYVATSTAITRVDPETAATTTLVSDARYLQSVAVDGTRLYFFAVDPTDATRPAGVFVLPKTGGNPALFFTPAIAFSNGALAVDASGLYVTTSVCCLEESPHELGELWRVPADGAAQNLAGGKPGQPEPGFAFGDVVLGPRAVYWTSAAELDAGIHELCE